MTSQHPLSPTALNVTMITNSVRGLVPATTFSADTRPYIEQELAAVKPMLLYADHIELRSYLIDIAHMAGGLVRRSHMPVQGMYLTFGLIQGAHPETLADYGITVTHNLRHAVGQFMHERRNPNDANAISELATFWDEHAAELSAVAEAFFTSAEQFNAGCVSGMDPLDKAVRAGILRKSGWSDQPPGLFEDEQSYVDRAGSVILELMHEASRPIAIDAGSQVTLGGPSEGTSAELQIAKEVLAPLPVFTRASVDELLDIRRELDRPLHRFRLEVSRLARPLSEGEVDPAELRSIWKNKMASALQEIDDLAEENRYLRQLLDKATDPNKVLPAAATFALGVGGLAGVAQVVAAAAGLAALPLDSLRSWQKHRKDLRRDRFYFLWNLQRRS